MRELTFGLDVCYFSTVSRHATTGILFIPFGTVRNAFVRRLPYNVCGVVLCRYFVFPHTTVLLSCVLNRKQ